MQRHHSTPYQRLQPKLHHPNSVYLSPAGDQDHLVLVQKYAPPSMYHPHLPYASQPPPAETYSVQSPIVPSYSMQALKTFAPQQMAYTPDAVMVPIRSLRSEKSFVRVSGRTIRAPEVKAFPDRNDPGKHKWLLSFTIKDDVDTIDIKFWHKTNVHLDSYSHITLDQVVHIWTDDVKLNTKPSSTVQRTSVPTTSSPFCLSLGEGKVGHRIDIGNETEMTTLFKTALGANMGGVVACISIKQVIAALSSVGSQRFNLVVCIKALVSSGVITSKNGPLTKTLLRVFDAQGQEASIVLWGDILASVAQKWVSFNTILILTGAQVDLYNMTPQIKIGYQTHIQVDPLCKNAEWLKHFAAQYSTLSDELSSVAVANGVPLDHIRACYRIIDISRVAKSSGITEMSYGITFAILSELDIESRAADILTAKCPSCKAMITSYKMEACHKCNVIPKSEDSWSYSLARHISFQDDTAELRHPSLSSEIVQSLLGFKPKEFSALSLTERAQLKRRHFLERYKLYFKVSWSDFKKQQIVHVLAIELAHLRDLESFHPSFA